MTWANLSVCKVCWDLRNPGRTAHQLTEDKRKLEQCCHCGIPNRSGIYVRVNTDNVAYPPMEGQPLRRVDRPDR